MALVSDAKEFVRDMVDALEVSLERMCQVDAQRQLLLASQLIGSCDSLSALLVFLGESVPKMRRFAATGRRKLAVLRSAARKVRAEAYRELLSEEPPVIPDDQASTDEQQPVADPAPDAQSNIQP